MVQVALYRDEDQRFMSAPVGADYAQLLIAAVDVFHAEICAELGEAPTDDQTREFYALKFSDDEYLVNILDDDKYDGVQGDAGPPRRGFTTDCFMPVHTIRAHSIAILAGPLTEATTLELVNHPKIRAEQTIELLAADAEQRALQVLRLKP